MAVSKVILNGTTLMDVTQDTVSADKLLQTYTATKNDGTKVTGTYVPQSGASNIVTGTFTGTSDGSFAIDLGYSGNGYPISYYIFSKEGKRTDTGIVMYAKLLNNTSVAPTYAVASDHSILIYHTTENGTMTYKGSAAIVFTHTQAANGINLAAAMSNKTTLNVYIGTGKNNFTVDKEYVYVVVYSE